MALNLTYMERILHLVSVKISLLSPLMIGSKLGVILDGFEEKN